MTVDGIENKITEPLPSADVEVSTPEVVKSVPEETLTLAGNKQESEVTASDMTVHEEIAQRRLRELETELGMAPASLGKEKVSKVISAEEASSIIAEDFPEFKDAQIKLLGQGQNAVTFEVDEEYLFRFPFRLTASVEVGDLDTQRRILQSLEGKLDVEIPRIEYKGKEQHYIGYRKIKGEVLTREVLETLTDEEKDWVGKDLAHFVNQMYKALPIEAAEEAGFTRRPFIKEESRKETEEFVGIEFEGVARDFFLRALQQSKELESAPHKEVPLHGDLDLGNMVLDPKTKRLKGVIDFGHAIGDVHRDFFYSRIRDPIMGKAMTEEYERTSGEALSRDTLQIYEVVRELRFLLRYYKNGNKKLFDEWRNKLMGRVTLVN